MPIPISTPRQSFSVDERGNIRSVVGGGGPIKPPGPVRPTTQDLQSQRAKAAKESIAGFLDYIEADIDSFAKGSIDLNIRNYENDLHEGRFPGTNIPIASKWVVNPKLKAQIDMHNSTMADYLSAVNQLSGGIPSASGGARINMAEYVGKAVPDELSDTQESGRLKLKALREKLESRFGALPLTSARFYRALREVKDPITKQRRYNDNQIANMLHEAGVKGLDSGALQPTAPSIDVNIPETQPIQEY